MTHLIRLTRVGPQGVVDLNVDKIVRVREGGGPSTGHTLIEHEPFDPNSGEMQQLRVTETPDHIRACVNGVITLSAYSPPFTHLSGQDSPVKEPKE